MTATHGFWLGLALGLTFALGFAAAVLVMPRAEAQSARGWRYTTVPHGFDGGRWANEMGAQGWRFVGFDANNGHMLIFEREQ